MCLSHPLLNPPTAALKSGSLQRVEQKKLYLYVSETLPLGNVSKSIVCGIDIIGVLTLFEICN